MSARTGEHDSETDERVLTLQHTYASKASVNMLHACHRWRQLSRCRPAGCC